MYAGDRDGIAAATVARNCSSSSPVSVSACRAPFAFWSLANYPSPLIYNIFGIHLWTQAPAHMSTGPSHQGPAYLAAANCLLVVNRQLLAATLMELKMRCQNRCCSNEHSDASR